MFLPGSQRLPFYAYNPSQVLENNVFQDPTVEAQHIQENYWSLRLFHRWSSPAKELSCSIWCCCLQWSSSKLLVATASDKCSEHDLIWGCSIWEHRWWEECACGSTMWSCWESFFRILTTKWVCPDRQQSVPESSTCASFPAIWKALLTSLDTATSPVLGGEENADSTSTFCVPIGTLCFEVVLLLWLYSQGFYTPVQSLSFSG